MTNDNDSNNCNFKNMCDFTRDVTQEATRDSDINNIFFHV